MPSGRVPFWEAPTAVLDRLDTSEVTLAVEGLGTLVAIPDHEECGATTAGSGTPNLAGDVGAYLPNPRPGAGALTGVGDGDVNGEVAPKAGCAVDCFGANTKGTEDSADGPGADPSGRATERSISHGFGEILFSALALAFVA